MTLECKEFSNVEKKNILVLAGKSKTNVLFKTDPIDKIVNILSDEGSKKTELTANTNCVQYESDSKGFTVLTEIDNCKLAQGALESKFCVENEKDKAKFFAFKLTEAASGDLLAVNGEVYNAFPEDKNAKFKKIKQTLDKSEVEEVATIESTTVIGKEANIAVISANQKVIYALSESKKYLNSAYVISKDVTGVVSANPKVKQIGTGFCGIITINDTKTDGGSATITCHADKTGDKMISGKLIKKKGDPETDIEEGFKSLFGFKVGVVDDVFTICKSEKNICFLSSKNSGTLIMSKNTLVEKEGGIDFGDDFVLKSTALSSGDDKSGGLLWLWITLPIVAIGAVAGVFFFVKHKKQ